MKRYVLFTEEELDDMIHGGEIKHTLASGETVYFMCKEHFLDNENDEEVVIGQYEIESLIFDTENDAKETLKRLESIRQWYGVVMVADLYDDLNLTINYQDNKYGWIDLEKAKIIENSHGYELKMPRALPLA